jgi:hypothetical protein
MSGWAYFWEPFYSVSTRWFSVGTWERGAQVQWGSAAEREEYRHALGRYFKGGPSVYPRGAWDFRSPSPGVFDPPVYLVAFPWWPVAAVGVAGGCVLLRPWKRREPGTRRVTAGVVSLGCSAALAAVWVCSGSTSKMLPLGAASVLVTCGVAYVDVPPGVREEVGRFAGNDLRWGTRPEWVFGTSRLVWWRWGIAQPGNGVLLRVWMPLWAPTVVAMGAGVWLVVRGRIARRRWKAGHCGMCGYDLRGKEPGAKCPECGTSGGGAPKRG